MVSKSGTATEWLSAHTHTHTRSNFSPPHSCCRAVVTCSKVCRVEAGNVNIIMKAFLPQSKCPINICWLNDWMKVGLVGVIRERCVFVCVLVAQSCLTFCDPTDCSTPGFSVHGILQARILEWVASPFSRGSSQPRDRTWVSYIVGRFFIIWASSEWWGPC